MSEQSIKKNKLFNSQISSSDPQKTYYHKIIAFLEDVFPNGLSISQAFGLMSILQFYQIGLRGGFVLNDEKDDEKVIGARDAGIIASHLCTEYPQGNTHRIHDYRWWTTAYYSKRDVTAEEVKRIQEKLLGRIMLHPQVEWVRV